MNEMINSLGERMVTLMRGVNLVGLSGNKLAYELNGMVMALKAMDIDYDFDYNYEVTEYTAVIINNVRFDV